MAKGKEIIWKAAEYEHQEKKLGWFVLIGAVALTLVVVALLGRNFFFAIFMVLATIMLFASGKRHPPILEFRVNDEGVWIGKMFFEYNRFEEFSLRDRPGRLDEIVLKKKTVVNPHLHIPIDSALAVEVKRMLKEKLPEVEHRESLVDVFAEWFGL